MSFSYYRSITVDHTKCGASDSSNFPMLVSFTNATLATTGNGGHVQNANGYDIGFYSNSSLTTKLNWEIDKYNATTGKVEMWVLISTLSKTTDNVIYMGYGDASISTFQGGAQGVVWDSNYIVVAHLDDNAATTTIVNSVSASSNGTCSVNTSTVTSAGLVNTGMYFNGASGGTGILINQAGSVSAPFTMECLLNPGTPYSTNFVAGSRDSNGDYGFGFGFTSTANFQVDLGNGSSAWLLNNTSAMSSAYTLTVGSWHHFACVVTSTTVNMYINGINRISLTGSWSTALMYNTTRRLQIGQLNRYATTRYIGIMDEARYSKTNRGVDWFIASSNNQLTPSTFFTLGSEVSNVAVISKIIGIAIASIVKAIGVTKTSLIKFIGTTK